MAEIGLVASIIGIVGAGAKLSIIIFDFASTIGTAGRELQSLGTEISLLCSVLKPLQSLLDHAHFHSSQGAKYDLRRIVDDCRKVFVEIDDIFSGLQSARGSYLFPSVDFVGKVKWTFKKSKVLMLRSTLDSCKLTLALMLSTMQSAERATERQALKIDGDKNGEQDQAMTQSLVISQQCAIEQLEQYEDEVEKEEGPLLHVAGRDARRRSATQKRHRSRLVRMFSGLTIETHLSDEKPPTRAERASVWLGSIVFADQASEVHPGMPRRRRLSSVNTAEAPQHLLRKWTDQAEPTIQHHKHLPSAIEEENVEIWRDSRFSFSTSATSAGGEVVAESPTIITTVKRVKTDPISPRSGSISHIGLQLAVTVDAGLHASVQASPDNESYSTTQLTSLILQRYGVQGDEARFALCILYGGKARALTASEKPLQVFQQLNDLGLEPRFVIHAAEP